MTHTACAFITGRFCPRCGYELTGLPFADLVTCPECGTGTEGSALGVAPLPGPLGRLGYVLARATGSALVTVVIVGLFLALVQPFGGFWYSRTWSCGRPLDTLTLLEEAHRSMVIYAREEAGGKYPLHAAVLIPQNYLGPEWLSDPDSVAGTRYVGGYDLWGWDGSDKASAALNAAVETTDLTAPYYRLVDFWWVRLAAPTGDPFIVAGWSTPRARGNPRSTRWVVFDDGAVFPVNSREWRTLWKADTAARRKLGLAPVEPIPP